MRQSVALFWLETNPAPEREVHPPEWHREIVTAIYDHNDRPRAGRPGRGRRRWRARRASRSQRTRITTRSRRRWTTWVRTPSPRSARCSTSRRRRAATWCTSSCRSPTRRPRRSRTTVHDELGHVLRRHRPGAARRRHPAPAVAQRGRGATRRHRSRVRLRRASCSTTSSSASTRRDLTRVRPAGRTRPGAPVRAQPTRSSSGFGVLLAQERADPRVLVGVRVDDAGRASQSWSPIWTRTSGPRAGSASSRTSRGRRPSRRRRRGRSRTRSRSCAVCRSADRWS